MFILFISSALVVHGLDRQTTESAIVLAISDVSRLDILNVRVMRDGLTGMSQCYAFVHMTSADDCERLLDTIRSLRPLFVIDGKSVSIEFAEHDFSTM